MQVTCTKCGRVHFGVTREYAENEVKTFNEWYDKQPDEIKKHYAGPSSIAQYDRCSFCGTSYENMRPFKEGDCPDGVTLGPIIVEISQQP